MQDYPVIADYHPDRVFAWHAGQPVTCGRALAGMHAIKEQLAAGRAYLNMCEDRYIFTLAFAAVCLAGGANLLPASHASGALQAARRQHADAGELRDAQILAWLQPITGGDPLQQAPAIAAAHCAAVVFTSGTTGAPTAHRKNWGALHCGTLLLRQRFFPRSPALNIVATVPPQHMYGLETSVLPALQAGFAAHSARPAMPWEIADALAEVPAPRVLVTTPVHLRACVRAATAMPEIFRCISATAPLAAALAQAAEDLWQTQVHEIYGCTEAGSLASRRTCESGIWTLYDGMHLRQGNPPMLSGPQLPQVVPLNDDLQILQASRFRLLGRSQDMLKVAGKRIAMSELTQRLLEIEGVNDAVAFLPDDMRSVERPAALVVAPDLLPRDIAARLAAVIDPVFIPRPLLRVPALPRNAVGKLPHAALQTLFTQTRKPDHG